LLGDPSAEILRENIAFGFLFVKELKVAIVDLGEVVEVRGQSLEANIVFDGIEILSHCGSDIFALMSLIFWSD
jgi:hypothetical protein